MNVISREFPAMLPRLEELYAMTCAPAAFRQEAQAMVRVLQSRYGLAKRHDAASSAPTPAAGAETEADAGQVGFAWD